MNAHRIAITLLVAGLMFLFGSEALLVVRPRTSVSTPPANPLVEHARVLADLLAAAPPRLSRDELAVHVRRLKDEAAHDGDADLLARTERLPASPPREPGVLLPDVVRIGDRAVFLEAARAEARAQASRDERTIASTLMRVTALAFLVIAAVVLLGPLRHKLAEFGRARALVPGSSNPLDADIRRLLEGVRMAAMHSADAITIERLLRTENTALTEQIQTDALTGLASATAFEDATLAALEAYIEGGPPFAVFAMDMDLFKRINDTYGHAEGDRALVHAADRLRDALADETATLARPHGDEFAALTIGDLTDARAFGERVLAAMHGTPFSIDAPDAPGGQIAIHPAMSIGLVHIERTELSALQNATADPERAHVVAVLQLLKQADSALYHAKRSGRNCMREYDPGGRAEAADRVELDSLLLDIERHAVDYSFRTTPERAAIDAHLRAARAILVGQEAPRASELQSSTTPESEGLKIIDGYLEYGS